MGGFRQINLNVKGEFCFTLSADPNGINKGHLKQAERLDLYFYSILIPSYNSFLREIKIVQSLCQQVRGQSALT